MATIATVTAAVQATWGSDRTRLTKDKLHNPTEWYVADDPASRTRYFIIQGSDTLDHWKVNLTFDPVVFEDPSLGVKVTANSVLFLSVYPILQISHLTDGLYCKSHHHEEEITTLLRIPH